MILMARRPLCIFSLALAAVLVTQASLQASQLPYTWVFVSDMHCGHCAKKISTKLEAVSGVAKVQCDVKKGFAVLTPKAGASLSPRAVWEAVEQVKFTPVKLQGPSGTYEAKPDR
jgi:copper chaperone CopZ